MQVSYEATGNFPKIILDYVHADKKLHAFYTHPVSIDGIKAAIAERRSYPTDRKLLVEVFNKHYADQTPNTAQQNNIQRLSNANCFTITTAHQPNIFTGHLYFIYKILHAIKLAETLKAQMPENDFVPVFYMGSEDADLEELGHIYINEIKHEWKTNQTGAVGRMKVDKALVKMLETVEGEITVHPFGKEIVELMRDCYIEGNTIEQATFKLVNKLFGEYGLIIFLPDNADYKNVFIPVVEKELKEQFSYNIVEDTVAKFPKEYKVQAGGRELNMFYLQDDTRERIEKRNEQYSIVNAQISFSEAEMMEELKIKPEKFSPNVILRPVFQEMLLPDIAFIGGGGEIAYWLELKNVFAAVNVPFPVLVLRNSFLWVEANSSTKIKKLGFNITDLFKAERELLNTLVKRDSEVQLSLEKEKDLIREFYSGLGKTAGAVDSTLQPHTEALEKLALRKIEALEKKMLRAEKKKFETQQRQLQQLKAQLFPHNSLQERIENVMPLYAKWGRDLFNILLEHSLALEQQFVIIEEG